MPAIAFALLIGGMLIISKAGEADTIWGELGWISLLVLLAGLGFLILAH